MSEIVPAAVKLASKRGFIRTTAQSYATALAGGISAAAIISVISGELALVPLLITAGVTVVSPVLAGGASYLSIIAKGLPEEYVPAAIEQYSDGI